MTKLSEIRLSIAAFIFSIEKDLRVIIKKHIIPQFTDISFLRPELRTKISNRFKKQNSNLNPVSNLDALIDFIDFQDNYRIIIENKQYVPNDIVLKIKKIIPNLDKIAPIRNRVMHSRPLHKGDFNTVFSFIHSLDKTTELPWAFCNETLEKIKDDPSFVLDLAIPEYWGKEEVIEHNLPFTDFDETGFIGRENDVKEIKKLILTNPFNGVISIIGEGGIGKTAIALKIAYDILDLSNDCPYDIIVWTSAKTTIFTINGVENIKDTILNFKGLIDEISHHFQPEQNNIDDTINEILLFMDLYKVLLIIDNLETILDDKVRDFIRKAQTKSKVLLTSRIGLGELEYPRKIEGFTESESIIYIREIASVRNTELLIKMQNQEIIKFAKKLFYNPLALKWFAKSVDFGKTPDEVINCKHDLLNFCLSNVYEKISKNSIIILNTLLASRRNQSTAMLIYLSELEPLKSRKAINELLASSFLKRQYSPTSKSYRELEYFISEFVREYIIKNYPPNVKFVKKITKKLHILQSEYEDMQRLKEIDRYRIDSIDIQSENQKIIAKRLVEALKESRSKNFDVAFDKILEAKNFMPDYVEIYKISAFIKAQKGDLIGAEDEYLKGFDISPEDKSLLYFYAGFLLMSLDDVKKALSITSRLIKLDNSVSPSILYVRCLTYNGQYEKSILSLKDLLSQTQNLSSKQKKLVYTLIIEAYQRWADDKFKIEKDFNLAIEYYKNAIIYFEKAVLINEFDFAMIKKVANAIMKFLYIPSANFPKGNVYFKNIIEKNFPYIKRSKYFGGILSSLHRNYNVNIDRSLLINIFADKTKLTNKSNFEKGQITSINYNECTFKIATNKDEVFKSNKSYLKKPSCWQFLYISQTVYFHIGSNKKGLYANNIIPVI